MGVGAGGVRDMIDGGVAFIHIFGGHGQSGPCTGRCVLWDGLCVVSDRCCGYSKFIAQQSVYGLFI